MARSHGLKTKTLRRMLKKKGLKTTGKKVTLMKRLHMRGGEAGPVATHKVKNILGQFHIVDTTPKEVEVSESVIAGNKDGFTSFDAATAAFDATPPPNAILSRVAPVSVSTGERDEGGRRRRSRRRREEGGKRRGRKSRRGAEMLGY